MPNRFQPISPGTNQDQAYAAINQNFAALDNEVVTKVFTQSGNSNALIIGRYGNSRYGMVGYDTSGLRRILIGQAPDDGRPGIWVSKDGQDVVTLLLGG